MVEGRGGGKGAPTRKELAWVLKVILKGENIWNHLNCFSKTGAHVGDILDRLGKEEVEEPDARGR
jgi:hypothetical protein